MIGYFYMIRFCECLFEIRVLLNSLLTMGIIFHQLQSTGTRLRPPPGNEGEVSTLLPKTAL